MRIRRNPSDPRHTKIIVERGYFHTGNSGISISMIEETNNYDWDATDADYYDHHLEVRHSAFGQGSSFRTPIAGPAMCDYYIQAFERLRNRMLNDMKYKLPTIFNRYDKEEVNNDIDRIVDIENGFKREQVWAPEIIINEHSTEKRLLGYNYINQETGEIDHFEPIKGEYATNRYNVKRKPQYNKSDIGKVVCDAKPLPETPPPTEEDTSSDE